MRNVAHYILKLNGGVMAVEIGSQYLIYVAKNGLTLRGRNIFNADVAGECMSVRADAPHMHIMNVVHAMNGTDVRDNLFDVHAGGDAFQQYIQRLPDDA